MQWTQDLPFTHFPIHETVHLLSPIVIAIIEVKYSQEIQKSIISLLHLITWQSLIFLKIFLELNGVENIQNLLLQFLIITLVRLKRMPMFNQTSIGTTITLQIGPGSFSFSFCNLLQSISNRVPNHSANSFHLQQPRQKQARERPEDALAG